jgi:sensitive to high expression protein 9
MTPRPPDVPQETPKEPNPDTKEPQLGTIHLGLPTDEQQPEHLQEDPKDSSSKQPPPPESSSAPEQPATNPSSSSQPEHTSKSQQDPQQHDPRHQLLHDLPSHLEAARSHLLTRLSSKVDHLQARLLTASQTLNDLTGYSSIESIKQRNIELEQTLFKAQDRLKHARDNYKSLNTLRATTQREVTTLLARKDTWTPGDVERFTTLYRSDHELEAKVAEAAAELTEAESEESRLGAALNAGILRRYHEEQIWSDRIRRASTWGTWGLMGVNVLLFIVLQFVAEPWKRRRLVNGFAEAERGVWEEVQREVGEVRGLLLEVKEGRVATAAAAAGTEEARDAIAMEGPEPVLPAAEGNKAAEVEVGGPESAGDVAEIEIPALDGQPSFTWASNWEEWKEDLTDAQWWNALPGRCRVILQDLYSDRRIDLRMRDATVIALEGAVTGAAVAAGLALLLLRSSTVGR